MKKKIKKRKVKRTAILLYDKKKLDRNMGINMYKCFGRTNFKLTKMDLHKAKKLRARYVEGGA